MYGGTRVEEDLADLRTSRYLYFIAAAAENQTCTSKVGRGAPPPLPPALSMHMRGRNYYYRIVQYSTSFNTVQYCMDTV